MHLPESETDIGRMKEFAVKVFTIAINLGVDPVSTIRDRLVKVWSA
jgi:hypothetical protein